MSTETKNPGSELLFVRDYFPPVEGKNHEVLPNIARMNHQCDAILQAVATLDQTPSLEMVNDINWVVNAINVPITIANDVFFEIIDIVKNQSKDEGIKLIKFKVYSHTLTAKTLVTMVTKMYGDYNARVQHDLLGHQFYFDQKYRNNERQDMLYNPHDDDPRSARKHMINQAPKHLSFVKYNFKSNKTFANLFGEDIDIVKSRVKHFLDNKEWYQHKGIPYQLGVCLSGTSGTGKTSCIGAIANMTQRHVINVNCADILTHTQLKRLFYDEDIHVYKDEDMRETIKFHIPIENRIYVLEELDAVGSTLYDRDDGNKGFSEDALYDELTLGHWLQIFDDVNQVEGRIMVITTNHPERLDKALLRPGRIDINLTLENATRSTIAQMYSHFFDQKLSKKGVKLLPNKVLSPADVSNVMQSCMTRPKDVVKELLRKADEVVKEKEEVKKRKNGQVTEEVKTSIVKTKPPKSTLPPTVQAMFQ
jgi:ATP-dependent 26S proteasome regulatory subunit